MIWKENRTCFDGACSMESELERSVKFYISSWVSILPQVRGISIDSTLRSWYEVAFSTYHPNHLTPPWTPPPLGFVKLNFDGSVMGNPSPSDN